MFLSSFALAMGLALVASPAFAVLTDDQQSCATTVDKSFAKLVKAVNKEIGACLKSVAKSKSSATCLGTDSKGKVAKTRDKLLASDKEDCAGAARPDFGYGGAAATFTSAEAVDDAMITALFGEDPASALPTGAPDADLSKCQQSVTKALSKCVDTQAKEYTKCRKKAVATADDVTPLTACVTDDPKGKVAKSCDLDADGKVDKLRGAIAKSCEGVDLAAAFPGCATADPAALHACLVAPARCEVCKAATVAGEMESVLDCDAFDNESSDGSCALVFGEHVSIVNDVEPAETPGTPGVAVTNPKLLAQFGGDTFTLNQSEYTRWRLAGSDDSPDAIVIAVPGFGGGANNFKIMAEDLIAKALANEGLQVELWGYHRRSELLEDREGAILAADQGDAELALDWFYGAELGFDLDPRLERRAEYYNTSDDVPFLGNWNTQVFSRDIDVIVEAANAASGNNVFLAGHSAGTGFAARYAATNFDLTGIATPEPGYAKLKGLMLFEGGGGTTANDPLSADSIARIEDRFDGGLFAAIRDNAPRCVDGTPCTFATEATDCAGKGNARCTDPTTAYSALGGVNPQIAAGSEPNAIQGLADPNSGLSILQRDTNGADTAPIDLVPGLAILANPLFRTATVEGVFGQFLDDDSLGAELSSALATSLGELSSGSGVRRWLDINDAIPGSAIPDNGPQPTTLPASRWGQEKEVVSMARFRTTFLGADTNAADWYFASGGLGMTSVAGFCDATVCTRGAVGEACTVNSDCSQSVSLDSTALSVGASRPDIVNLTEAGNIDIPVICFGGSNGLTPVGASFRSMAESLATCAAASCDGTVRLVDDSVPSEAFPTFGDVAGGFEVYIREGLAHNDVLMAEDTPDADIIDPLLAFVARNVEP